MHRFLSFCLLTLTAATLPAETFRNPYRIPTPIQPDTVIVGDVNNDGRPDILYGTGEFSASTLHPLIAQSNGTYLPGTDITLPFPIGPRCKLADLNADHNLDLICGSDTAEEIAVLLGNEDGTFQPAITITLGTATLGTRLTIAAIGDVDNDGHQDIIVTDPLATRDIVLLGDGTGHATVKSLLADGGSPILATLRDLNGDGNLDLITQGETGADVAVFLGHGDGTFATAVVYPNNFSVVLGDADGDGQVDLIGGGQGHLTILHGNPDGTFAPTPIASVNYSSPSASKTGFGSYISAYAYLDLNGDGIPDILARGTDGLTVILGKPGLQFAPPAHYPVAQDFFLDDLFDSNTLVDMDGDGHPDFISAGPNGVYITYGRADGSFASANVYESGTVDLFATVADFNEDGIPDVVTSGDTQLQLNLGNGDGTFRPATSIPGTVAYSIGGRELATRIVHGDFNGDGHQDLITIGSPSIYTDVPYLLLGHGDGTFAAPVALPTQIAVTDQSTIGDFNHDGRDDIAVLSTSTQPASLVVFLSQPDGSFSPVTTNLPGVTGEGTSSFLAFADLNHDGILDLAYATTNHVFIMLGKGDGTFSSPSSLPVPPISDALSQSAGTVTIGDFDGDGKPDLALFIPYSRTYGDIGESPTQIDVFYNNGFPSFSSPVTGITSFHSYTQFTASDLNQDGLSDLIYSNGDFFEGGPGPNIGIIHGLPGRTLSSETNYVAGTGLASILVVDLNHDGLPDIVASNGDYNDTANSFTVLLNQGNTPSVQGILTASPEPSTVGQPFTLTATLAPPPPSTATLAGLIQFAIDGTDVGSATLSSNAATITAPSTLSIGTHTATATWFGNSTYPAITLTATHTVEGIPVTLNLTSSLNPAAVGQAVVLSAAVANSPTDPPSTPTPTGTLTFTDNGTPLGTPVSITGGGTSSWSLLKGFSTGGKHIIVVTYSGDAIHSPATATLTEIVTALPTTTVLQSSLNPSPAGQPVTFTATITAQPENSLSSPFQTSTVTFTGLPGGPITRPVTFSSQDAPAAVIGTATYTTNTLLPGTYTITAAFSGNASLNPSTSAALTQIVNSAITTTTLTATPNPAYVTQTVTLSAAVNSSIGTPTGTIQFFDGTTSLTTVPLTAGNATFATALLTPGDHTITAQYSGDANNLPSTSSPITETILPSDFTLSIDPSSLTLITGHHTTLTLTATSVGSFADTIHLTIGSLPQWTTVTFTHTDLTLTPGAKATTKVYVDTDAVIGYISQSQPKRNPFSTAIATTLALILLPLTNRRTRRLPTLIALAITATLLIGSTGCSGMYPGSTAPGTYNLQITATGKQTPITHTLNLPLTVTK